MTTRRGFLVGSAAVAAGLLLSPTLAENAEAARRYWALDRTMLGSVRVPPSAYLGYDVVSTLPPYYHGRPINPKTDWALTANGQTMWFSYYATADEVGRAAVKMGAVLPCDLIVTGESLTDGPITLTFRGVFG
jgi:hypothetical protein